MHVSDTEDGDDSLAATSLTRSFSTRQIQDKSLLRGVRLSTLMRSYGELFEPPQTGWQYGGLADADALYALSEEISELQQFISHSWRDSRWLKYLALHWVNNLRPATICANLAAAVWVSAEALGAPLPTATLKYENGIVNVFGLSWLVYSVVFFAALPFVSKWKASSQYNDDHCFLDKVCIHQTDPDRKARGIASLGGYLRHSQRMLVFWSPDYFTRLWCNYELACFVSLAGFKRIDFVPLLMPLVVLVFGLGITFSQALLWTGTWLQIGGGAFFTLLAVSAFLPLSIMGSFLSRALLHRTVLQRQLAEFELANARCYCCDASHKSPDTGAPIPCDRLFVEGNVSKWFSELSHEEVLGNDVDGTFASCQLCLGGTKRFSELAHDEDIDGVHAFSSYVRVSLAAHVREMLGPTLLPLPFSAIFMCSSLFVWFGLDIVVLSPDYPVQVANLVEFGLCPLLFTCMVAIHCAVLSLLRRCCGCLFDWCPVATDVAVGPLFLMLFCCLWGTWDTLAQDPTTSPVVLLGAYVGCFSIITAIHHWELYLQEPSGLSSHRRLRLITL